MRRASQQWLPLVAGVLAFVFWLAFARIGRLDIVWPRDFTFETGPYALAIMVGFTLVIAMSRQRPAWSLIFLGVLLLLQVLFWPARFSQVAWVGYAALLLVPAFISRSPRTTHRPLMLGGLLIGSAVVGALLTMPALSISGEWGTVTGKDLGGSIHVALIWTAVALLATWGSWRIGRPRVAAVEPKRESLSGAPLLAELSPREVEMFELVAAGKSNSEIAISSYISETTVKTHVSNILAKLGLSSRSELIAFAWSRGLVTDAPQLSISADSSG